MRARQRGQRGGSLIIVLAVTLFIAILVPAVLSLQITGSRLTSTVISERRTLYAATSALDAAMQHGRTAEWVGRFGLTCPTLTTTVGSTSATVTCTSSASAADIDRVVAFTARVGGTVQATATVLYQDSAVTLDGSGHRVIPVFVTRWSADVPTA